MGHSRSESLREGKERSAPAVLEIHEAIRLQGEHELERPPLSLATSGLAAGLSMGFSLVAEGLLTHYLPEATWTPLVSKFGYAAGFLIVILGRQQLFTENTLTPILALFSEPSRRLAGLLARLWAVVLAANWVGAALFAYILARTPVVEPSVKEAFSTLSLTAVEPEPSVLLLRAVIAGWLIALMVWLIPFAETARVWVIVGVAYLIGLGHFSHVIAGSVNAFFLVWAGHTTFLTVLTGFLLPTLAGNTLGGVTLVAMVHHAQVRIDAPEEKQEVKLSPFGAG